MGYQLEPVGSMHAELRRESFYLTDLDSESESIEIPYASLDDLIALLERIRDERSTPGGDA